MTRYIHHISGRLRTRYPQLRNNPRDARATETAIHQIKGVLSVEASTVTGSLLIRYDPAGVERGGGGQADAAARQAVRGEEALQRLSERLWIAHLPGRDDTRRERRAREAL